MLPEKVTDRIDAAGDCWQWTGATRNGYGSTPHGRKEPRHYAHRFVWEALVGSVPEGLVLDHLCRNKLCVNPDHLEPVTELENFARGVKSNGRRKRTHCPHGHPYEGVNLYIDPKGYRQCRECHRRRQAVYNQLRGAK